MAQQQPPDFLTDEQMTQVGGGVGGDDFLTDEQIAKAEGGGGRVANALRKMGVSEEHLAEMRALDEAQRQSIPGQLSMAGGFVGGAPGAGLGAMVGTKLIGGSDKDAALGGITNAAIPAALNKIVASARPMVSGLLRRGAERTMKSALKPDRGYLEKMAGARKGGIVKMETDLVRTALENNVNPLRQSGTDKIQGLIDDVAQMRQTKIQRAPNAPVRGSASQADRAARVESARLAKGDATGDDRATAAAFLDDLRTSPATTEVKSQGVSFQQTPSPIVGPNGQPIMVTRAVPGQAVSGLKDLTPRELDDTVRAGNDRLRGMFGGNSKNAEVQSRLGVQRARSQSLDRAAGTRAESDTMKRLIDLRNVAQIARRRAEARDPIGITDIISLSAGNPAVTVGSAAMKPAMQGDLARMMSSGSRRMSGPPSELGDLIRQLLISGTINQP